MQRRRQAATDSCFSLFRQRINSLQLLTLYLSTIGSLTGPSLDLVKFGKLSRWAINGKPLVNNKKKNRKGNCPSPWSEKCALACHQWFVTTYESYFKSILADFFIKRLINPQLGVQKILQAALGVIQTPHKQLHQPKQNLPKNRGWREQICSIIFCETCELSSPVKFEVCTI